MRIARSVLLAAGIAAQVAATNGAASAAEVKIAVVMATTGTFAFVGAPLVNGVKMAEEELQAKNFFGDTKVTVIYADNQSDKQQAITLFNKMATADKVDMIIGPVSTGEAMATAPVAVDLKIPMYSTATDPAVLQAGPWVFKSTEIAEAYMAQLGKAIAGQVKPKSCFVVFIRDNEGYVRQSNIFRDTIKAGGVNIAGEESILAADTDFTALATKIVASKADCLFMSTPPAQGANIVVQAKQSGLAADAILVGNTGMTSGQYTQAGAAVNNTYIPADYLPSGVNDFAKTFIANYTKKYNVAPDGWAGMGYSMMLVAANAVKNAGAEPTRDSIREAMAKTKDVQVVIGQGTYSIDADRIPHYGTAVLLFRDGKWGQP